MHRNGSLRPRSFPLQALVRKYVEVGQGDINEHRFPTHCCNRYRRRGRAQSGQQNFVSGPDTEGPQTDGERIGTRSYTDAFRDSAVSRKFLLERFDSPAQNVASAGENSTYRLVDLFAKVFVSQSNVIKFHAHDFGTIWTPSMVNGGESRVISE